MKKIFFLSLVFIFIYAANTTGAVQIEDNIYNIRDFGAIGDGKTLNTQAIQKAIDVCAGAGGGTVYFPPGTYIAGSFYLKSNITLYLSTGAIILGSKDMKDYDESEHHYGSRYFFIYGRDVKNVSIVGGGTIDGNMALDNNNFGPLAVIFEYSENILIKDIDIINSAGTAPCIHYCNHVDIIRVRILDSFGAGISTSCCTDLLIDGVLVDSSRDDPLVLKNEGKPGSFGFLTKDVIITNTTIRNTSHGAIKIGTGTAGVFRNIVVSNCTFENTGPMFLLDLMRPKKKETTERLIENIIFSNITLRNVERMFRWTSLDVNRPIIRNISIDNIIADGVHTPSIIYGLPDAPISDLTFSNIKVTYRGDPAPYWLKARYVNGMKLNNVQLQLGGLIESALIYENGEGLELNSVDIQGISGKGPVIKLSQVKGAYIHNMQLPEVETFLYAEGEKTHDISLVGNDFSKAIIPFDAANEVQQGAVFPKAEKVSYSNLEVTKEIKANEGFKVNVTLTNTGKTGAFKAGVYVNGKLACSKWLWLEQGENRKVVLTTPRYYKPQGHEIKVGHLTIKAKVKPTPAAFEFGETVKINSPASAGKLTSVTVPLKNIGGDKGTKDVKLFADGEVVASKKVTLGPGEEKYVTIEHLFEQAGLHNIKIADFPVWNFVTYSNTEAHYYQTHDKIIIEAGGGKNTLWSEKEEYTTAYLKDIEGDFIATMYLLSQTVTGAYAEVGFMVRNDITMPGKSPGFVILSVEPKYGAQQQWRADTDGNGLLDSYDYGWVGYPMWFKLEKRGKTFTAYTSPYDTLWYKNDSVYAIPSAGKMQDVGIYANAFSVKNELNRAVLQYFKLEKPVPEQAVKYSNLKISKTRLTADEYFTVSAIVSNTSSVSGPVKAVFHFDDYEPYAKWIEMEAGESKEVKFCVTPLDIKEAFRLGFVIAGENYWSGTHNVTIGTEPPQTIIIIGENEK